MNNKIKTIVKEKGFLILMLTAVIAITGITAFSITKEKTENQNNLYVELEDHEGVTFPRETPDSFVQESTTAEKSMQMAEAETTFPGDALLAEAETTLDTSNLMDATDEPISQMVDAEGAQGNHGAASQGNGEIANPEIIEQVAGPALNLAFTEESTMSWPVEGNVILDYSMDGTVYFPTLKQYKYNPAIIIQSEVNTPVLASAGGIVVGISSNEEIGEYVLMELGNDYQLLYGQLKAIEVKEGDSVEAGQVIGFVSEPTKYYVVEGSNLYLKMLKDEAPVDPLDYIR